MIIIKQKGNFNNTEKLLKNAQNIQVRSILEKYARQGVSVLSSATPVESGLTSNSWDYEIDVNRSGYSISWTNSNIINGVPVVVLLQYGHATRSGGYVQGRDFINPAMKPIFNAIAEDLWKEVKSL